MNKSAIAYALLSAALFGVSTPAAKAILSEINPIMVAGLLYCGAGFGVAIMRRVVPWFSQAQRAETTLKRGDIPWLAASIAAGGIAGPLLLMLGLSHTDAASASLFLSLEGAATAILAWIIFGENFNVRVVAGMVCLLAGTIVLAWSGQPTWESSTGPLLIVSACIAWGLDNNFTRKISLSDPLQIVALKGMVAGPFNVALGLYAGGSLPLALPAATTLLIGFIGYGVSLALFVLALRHLGAARTSAYFATAPFLGAAAAVLALGYPVTLQLAVGGFLMALGVWLHLTERHEHEHIHEPMTHEHAHVHDEHHQHQHDTPDPLGEPHTHVHAHGYLRHTHPHVPDMHHVHRH